jgi:hypothetical protein
MKKMIIVLPMLMALAGCSEKKEYEQAVLEQMKTEKDIQDYKISLEEMVECVVKTSSGNMPGFSDFDPYRLKAYKNYALMLTLKKSVDPKKTLDELRQSFGSAKNLAEAHTNYTESVVECVSGIVTGTEEQKTPKDKEKVELK